METADHTPHHRIVALCYSPGRRAPPLPQRAKASDRRGEGARPLKGKRGSRTLAQASIACPFRLLNCQSNCKGPGPHTSLIPAQPPTMSDKEQPTTMERILQEITAVSLWIEGMDASISSLTLETKSMRSDIAGFQSRVAGLEHPMGTLEAHVATVQDRDQDRLYLWSKITDREDRSRRDNIRIFGIPENEEGLDVQVCLGSILHKLTSLTFEPPLEFQRAHRVGLKRPHGASRPRTIIACLLRHTQTRQLLQAARNH
ncbi:hypothetical protein NDU88_005759 [Pleurodeles waltl]|uniref:Uncharacterized protein n=1 Tax=Pleurodeles waltl TaxID=8319 RepID=A0AAV7MHX2_PLEWA|nr:hypothetical protein NDU88_005759 [Pleurodeles waltl]